MFHTILPFILSGDNMNDLIAYSFKDQVLRTQYNEEGEPLFCLADICEVLELTNPSSVAVSIKEEFGCPKLNLGHVLDSLGRDQNAYFITEPQMYYVLMRSKAKKARPFRQWVVNEVLPAIRKQGYYATQQKVKTKIERRLEYLQTCLNSNSITREEYLGFIKEYCEEYANP